ncbi:MAG TPA: hypothetical protein VGW40_12395 [Allosphingosinicella sp.]|nr:hypothetical protein [Allosphingosinicella sp.]
MNYVFTALMLICCAYAFIGGGAPERIGAAIFLIGSVLTYVVLETSPIDFRGVEVGVFIIDVVVFAAFVLLAVRANRYWPLWMSALLGLGVVGHLAMLLHPRVIPWAYAVVLSIWSYPILLLMAAGTFAHQRRLIRNGADPSWTRFSDRPGRRAPPPGPTP